MERTKQDGCCYLSLRVSVNDNGWIKILKVSSIEEVSLKPWVLLMAHTSPSFAVRIVVLTIIIENVFTR